MSDGATPAPRGYLVALTGLRGIGAGWVVIFHLYFGYDIPIVNQGYLGVDLFFILSGFVISYVHPENLFDVSRYLRFLRLRVARIYPLHFFVLCVLGLIVVSFPDFAAGYTRVEYRFSLGSFIASLFLVQNWGPWLPSCWNGPAWSLSAEWFAYLTFPISQFIAQRCANGRQAIGLALLGYLALFLLLTVKHVPFDSAGIPGMLRMIAGFGSGCLLYRAWKTGFVIAAPLGNALAIAFVALGVVSHETAPFALPGFAIVILLSVQQTGWIAATLATRPIVWLGNISYSLYLTHWLVIQLSNWWLRSATMSELSLQVFKIGLLIVIVAISMLSFRWIERPARVWARQFGDLRAPVRASS